MIEMRFLDSHIGILDDAINLANQFYWSITIKQEDDKWVVLTGEKFALVTDSKDTADAFLYGIGLAYSIIPDQLIDKFREMYQIDD
ncbi:MAG: hypothetical protein RLP44_10485 [Aggregatilineales bacterium]